MSEIQEIEKVNWLSVLTRGYRLWEVARQEKRKHVCGLRTDHRSGWDVNWRGRLQIIDFFKKTKTKKTQQDPPSL